MPTDPEVFGIALYTFWWSSLLLLLVALWNDEGRGRAWRLAFLLVGGFSGPVVVMILPVLLARALVGRDRRHELLVAILAAAIASAQLTFVLIHGVGQTPPLGSMVVHTIPVLLGKYLAGSWVGRGPILWAAAALPLAAIAMHWRGGAERGPFWILAYLLAGAVAMTVMRHDPAILDTRTAGPRYFFLPFVLLGWMLVQCVAGGPRKPQGILAALVLALAAINAMPLWSRQHADLRWTKSVRDCALSCLHPIPVHFDGSAHIAWPLWTSGRVCADRIARGLFPARDIELPTAPFVKRDLARASASEPGKLVAATMRGTDAGRSAFSGYEVIGSFGSPGRETGEVSVRMQRGGHLRYRTGASSPDQFVTIYATIHGRVCTIEAPLPSSGEWALLEFSGSALPEAFGVRIEDRGSGAGEWSAIAIKAP